LQDVNGLGIRDSFDEYHAAYPLFLNRLQKICPVSSRCSLRAAARRMREGGRRQQQQQQQQQGGRGVIEKKNVLLVSS
jgi:hypothetical protein